MKFDLISGGYRLDFRTDDSGRHRFCGSHDLTGGECPNCRLPLLLFLELNLSDPLLFPLQNWAADRLPLLFCWRCNLAQEPLFYKQMPDFSIQLLPHGAGGMEADFPYDDYPLFFPARTFELLSLPASTLSKIKRYNLGILSQITDSFLQYDAPIHQVGAEPLLVQRNPHYHLPCCQCEREMLFLGCIADHCFDPRGFTGNPYVQVLYHCCLPCAVVGCFQQTD